MLPDFVSRTGADAVPVGGGGHSFLVRSPSQKRICKSIISANNIGCKYETKIT